MPRSGFQARLSASVRCLSNVRTMQNYRAIIQAFYEDIWNQHNTAKIAEFLQTDFAFRGSLGDERHGTRALRPMSTLCMPRWATIGARSKR